MSRSVEERKADALSMLTARPAECWVASASAAGEPHLVPLSFAWDGQHLIVATESAVLTGRNIAATGRARAGLGSSRDVVVLDVHLVQTLAATRAPDSLAMPYADQAGWDPRAAGGDFTYFILRPDRIQVWRGPDEIPGRTVMKDGAWLA